VPRPRTLAPPPPASLHPPGTARTPLAVPAVPRADGSVSLSTGGGDPRSIALGTAEPLPLSVPAAGRGVRTTNEFSATEMPVDEEGLQLLAEGGATPGLPRIPLFWLLDANRLRSVLERCGRLEVPAGEVILRQGDQADDLYVILRGRVHVSVRSPRREEPLGRGSAGEFFGELPLLVQSRQPATVTAAVATALLRLDRALMEELLADAPPMWQMLLRTARDRAIERLVATSPLFDTLAVADAAALVARFEFRDLGPGMPLITEGEPVATLLVVLAGGCDVVFRDRGTERPVAVLGPGDLVGAVSLLERKPADVSVRTRTRVWALAMSSATFREVIVTYPTVLIHVGEVAQQRHARLAQLRG